MTAELAAEGRRIATELHWAMRQGPIEDSVPLRIHSRDTDGGGAPEFHPGFLRWVGPICICGRTAQCAPGCSYFRYPGLGHLPDCEPQCGGDTRFHASTRHGHPNRMKRALRQVRRLNPKAYDLVYLIVALHFSWDDAVAKLNSDHLARGREEMSEAEYAVLWVSGASLLTAAF